AEALPRLLPPGEHMLEPDVVLPPAPHYLVHPALSVVIGRANPASLQRVDRVNIVGYGRPWRETDAVDHTVRVDRLCVLKADVHGFGTLMRSGADAPVRKALGDGVKEWAQGALITQTRGGDAIMIVHDDPVALAQMA